MNRAAVRFYGETNDLLPAPLRQRTLATGFDGPASVKAVIEACGVPHTEVDFVLVNGTPATLSTIVEDGDRLAVFPRFRLLEPDPGDRLLPEPLAEPRFALDVHLGRLAGYLRLAGFDTAYRNDYSDPELAWLSHREDRTLVTRDRELLKRAIVTRGYWIRSTQPRRQFAEVVRHFGLERNLRLFTRCARCNCVLEAVSKGEVSKRLPPRVERSVDRFLRCPGCDRVYWEGTHVERIRLFIRLALEEPEPS